MGACGLSWCVCCETKIKGHLYSPKLKLINLLTWWGGGGRRRGRNCLLHAVESWPWIIVLHFATRIKGNLEQTHLASRDRRLFCLGSKTKKCKTRRLFKAQVFRYWRREREREMLILSFLLIHFFCVWAVGGSEATFVPLWPCRSSWAEWPQSVELELLSFSLMSL